MQHQMPDIGRQDPYAAIVNVVDALFLSFYRHLRKNSNRLARLIVALLPMMALLVGSCKISELPWAHAGVRDHAAEVRLALFPDAAESPALAYIDRARRVVQNMPDIMDALTRREVRYMLGAPSFVRRDAEAEVWQYRGDACVMDFYFYEAGAAVSYVDVRFKKSVPAGGEVLKPRCLGDIVSTL